MVRFRHVMGRPCPIQGSGSTPVAWQPRREGAVFQRKQRADSVCLQASSGHVAAVAEG